MRIWHATPADLPMQPENMPYYRGPRVSTPQPDQSDNPSDSAAQVVVSAIIVDHCNGMQHLSNVPIKFGQLAIDPLPSTQTSHSIQVLNNSELPLAARQLSQFDWAVYSFNDGHFIPSICSRNLPFKITLACDPYANGRALFKEFTQC